MLYLKIPQRKVHRTPTVSTRGAFGNEDFYRCSFCFFFLKKGRSTHDDDTFSWFSKTLYGPRCRLLFESILLPSYKKNTTFLLPKLPIVHTKEFAYLKLQ